MVVPGLDALEQDPTQLDALPPAERLALMERIEVLAARCRVRVLGAVNGHAPAPPPPAERALRVREAAQVLGMSVDYVHRNWRTLGGSKDVDGHVKFSSADLRKRLTAPRR